jgi:hypothetical protein
MKSRNQLIAFTECNIMWRWPHEEKLKPRRGAMSKRTPSNSPKALTECHKMQNSLEEGMSVPASSPYSMFTLREKRGIVFLVGFFSPFSAFIYFPALNAIAQSLSVSLELMNITITMYLVVQGIVPSVFGDLSDTLGWPPIYLLVFLIYLLASLSLAF